MNDRSRKLQLLLGLLAILMLVTPVVLHVQRIPPTNSDISKGQAEGSRPRDRFIPSYIPHSPITIASNADFVSQGFPGSGTAEDPYVIEGYNITTTGTCISIQGTDAYFDIRDCLLTGGSSGRGVRLDGVDHGEIRNNTISGINDCGVYLRYSLDNTVVNNTISGNNNSVFIVFSSNNNIVMDNTISGNGRLGVFIGYSSNNNTVVNNTISGNDFGVTIASSFNNTVVNNTISGNDYGVYLCYGSNNNVVVNNIISGSSYFGVHLCESWDNTLSSNIMVNNGIYISGNEVEYWRHNIAADNLVNGKQLGYFWNCTGGIIDGAQYGQVILANCTGMTVEDGVFRNASVAFLLGYSSYCSLTNNTLSGNYFGVSHYFSPNNIVMNNTVSGNHYGVYLDSSSDNTLSSNIFVNNGIFISGNEVEYWRHTITADNLVNGKLLGYFWNLTSGIIDGTQYGQVILANCSGVIVEDGVFSNLTVGIELGYSAYCSLMNNTSSGNEEGVSVASSSNNTISNNTIAGNNYGVYLHPSSDNNLIYLNVIADNNNENARDYGTGNHWNSTVTGNYWSDYTGTGVYHVPGSAGSIDYYPFLYPPETTPPTIDHPADLDYEEGTIDNTIEWNPSDAHPSHYVIYRNGTEVVSDSWDGGSVTVEIDGLSVGAYNYTIVVYDTSRNCASDTVLAIVLPQTTITTTTTTSTTTPNGDVTGPVFVFLGAGAIGVIVVVLILVKYRRGDMTG